MSMTDPAWEPSIAFRQSMDGAAVPAPRVRPADAFIAARRQFRAGDRLDMVALAQQLGISRATLYRWTGDRDRLLTDLITAEFVDLARRAQGHDEGRGVERLERFISRFIRAIATAPPVRAFLSHEGESGLRLLTAPRGPIRPRIVQTVADGVRRLQASGDYRPPAPAEILADGIVSLGERYLHNGGDPSQNPDPATALTIVRLLLREESA